MATTITPDAQHDNVDLTTPDDGEVWGVRTGPSHWLDQLQRIADRGELAREACSGLLSWTGQISVDPGGTSTVFTVRVGEIAAVGLTPASGVTRVHATTGESTLGLAQVFGSPAALAADTWYYVYAVSPGSPGGPLLLIHTDPPSDSGSPGVRRPWRRGYDGDWRYLGCFRTTTGGVPRAVRGSHGSYTYRDVPATWLHTALTATATTAISLAARVPLGATRAHVVAALTQSSPPTVAAAFLYPSGSPRAWLTVTSSAGAGDATKHLHTEISIDDTAAPGVDYLCGASSSLALEVLGWQE